MGMSQEVEMLELRDTSKGAEWDMVRGQMVLDCNYAYRSSCAYNPPWVCPLAQQHISFAIEAGEQLLGL